MANNAGTKLLEKMSRRKSVRVEYEGDKIVLPVGMGFNEAISWMERKRDEENTEVAISEDIDAFPLDGAVAFSNVLSRRYGWTNLVPTPGFFGDSPPAMIGVEVGPGETVQVPWGRCKIPKISGYLETSFNVKEGRPVFRLAGVVRRKDEKIINEIAHEVREEVRQNSIYRGQAIKMKFRDEDGNRPDFDPSFCPTFIDVTKIDESDLIFPQATGEMVETTLFSPVIHTEKNRRFNIPLKRGVMLEGPYGTGKTLTAYVLSSKCVTHGWTFLYVDDVRDLDLAIGFAKFYEPCVVFAEDVDRAVKTERSTKVDRYLNVLDGIDSKGHEIMVVLTSNNVDVINKAFLRPGRIDSVIRIDPPDGEAIVKLVRKYGNTENTKVDATDEQLLEVTEPLVGKNAAFIREAVERAKLNAVATSEDVLTIDADSLRIAASTMQHHLRLTEPPKPESNGSAGDAFVGDIADQLHNRLTGQGVKLPLPVRAADEYEEDDDDE